MGSTAEPEESDEAGPNLMSPKERIHYVETWPERYPQMCKVRDIPFRVLDYRPNWVDAEINENCIEYIENDRVLYPPWTYDVAKAKLAAFLPSSERPFQTDPIDTERFLADAAREVAGYGYVDNLPIALVECVVQRLHASGAVISSPTEEHQDGMKAIGAVKALPDGFIRATSGADVTYEVHELGVGIEYSPSTRRPIWIIFAKVWTEDGRIRILDGEHYADSALMHSMRESRERSSDSPLETIQDICHAIQTSYFIEETFNYDGARRISELCWALIQGKRPFPLPVQRGWGSSFVDAIAAGASAASALASVASAIIQARSYKSQQAGKNKGKKKKRAKGKRRRRHK